ncbi:MAG: outer rane porin, OprD family protein [Proteobacteria bacterium]|nr:outer rane porin, OprD family protein [Pseudomonadota bacterium]
MAPFKLSLPVVFISVCAAPVGATPFLADSQFDLTLKNVWMFNTSDQMALLGVGDQSAWARFRPARCDGEWNATQYESSYQAIFR